MIILQYILNRCNLLCAGLLIARSSASISYSTLPLKTYISVAGLMSVLGGATYLLLLAVGADPLWSIAKAVQWCAKKEWVHLSTSLFFSLVRDVSCLLGKFVVILSKLIFILLNLLTCLNLVSLLTTS